jgi:hypothetical protein
MGDESSGYKGAGKEPETDHQEEQPANTNRDGSQNKTCGPYRIHIQQTAPNAIGIQKEAKDNRRDRYDWIILWLVVGATIAAALAAGFTWWQASIARDNAKKELRAYVFVKPFRHVNNVVANRSLQTLVIIRNGGQTPAANLVLRASIAVRSMPPDPSPGNFMSATRQEFETILDPSTQGRGKIFNSEQPITPEGIAAIDGGQQAQIYVWGVATYQDVFDVRHNSYFCFRYFGRETSPDGGVGSRFRGICKHPNHN